MDSPLFKRLIFLYVFLHFAILLITFLGWAFPSLIPFFGLKPRTLSGLIGIVFHPFFHSDWKHLAANMAISVWLFPVLMAYLQEKFLKFFFSLWLTGGILIWLFGRSAIHIGESGWLYGFASYLFWLGIFTRTRQHLALSALTILFLSSLFIGLFPIDPKISWESHLYYAITGLVFAYDAKKQWREQLLNEDEESSPLRHRSSPFPDPIHSFPTFEGNEKNHFNQKRRNP